MRNFRKRRKERILNRRKARLPKMGVKFAEKVADYTGNDIETVLNSRGGRNYIKALRR